MTRGRALARLRLVVIESPYAGDIEKNVRYARAAMADSLARGEAPIASHLLYTQEGILNEGVPAERKRGILAGMAWAARADLVAFYVDHGWSGGMVLAWRHWTAHDMDIDTRSLLEADL